MDQRLSDQLDKVIALADSNHDGEAVVAVRKARQLLSKGGLRFSDLAQAASGNRRTKLAPPPVPSAPFPPRNRAFLEEQLAKLQTQFEAIKADLHHQSLQTDFWRRRAHELEQDLSHHQSEADRWRELAQETVNKLWDLGQALKSEEFALEAEAGNAPPARS